MRIILKLIPIIMAFVFVSSIIVLSVPDISMEYRNIAILGLSIVLGIVFILGSIIFVEYKDK